MPPVLVLNGPNLNMLGLRQPEIYGTDTLGDVEEICVSHGRSIGLDVTCLQSNHEGELVEALHDARSTKSGVILNAGAYTHTSIALFDAIVAAEIPVIELHLSNIHARESFRHHSAIAGAVIGQICGFGSHGYILALDALAKRLEEANS